MKFNSLLTAAALLAASLSIYAHGDAVEVQNAWARATVKGQMATGAFMTLKADHGARLVGASSPVAGVAQIHEMMMDTGVMKMAEVKGGLELPAGKTVELKPGGYHVMLMDLKQALEKGSTVPVTLIVQDAHGAEQKVELKLPVAMAAPGQAAAPAMHQHEHGQQPAPVHSH